MSRVTGRWWLFLSFGAAFWITAVASSCGKLSAESLRVHLDGTRLRVSVPDLHFLGGKVLERLRDGASVKFVCQLSLSTDHHATIRTRELERFVVSYDLWEEKFSVTLLKRTRRSASHLSSAAAEAWFLEAMTIDAAGLAQDQPFWIRIELRAEDPKEDTGLIGEPGINLARLIEIFSRPSRGQQPAVAREVGPLRLVDLSRASSG